MPLRQIILITLSIYIVGNLNATDYWSRERIKNFEGWKDQLKVGGRIVTPIGSSIQLLIKKDETNFDFEVKEYSGFAFVPLIEKH